MESLAGRRKEKFVTLAKIHMKINFLSLKMGSGVEKIVQQPKLNDFLIDAHRHKNRANLN